MRFRSEGAATVVLALCAALPLRAAGSKLDSAIALYRGKHYAEARAALRGLAASQPPNAAACYYFGMAVRHRKDASALADALPWLEKAAKMEPANATYVGDYGGTCLELAGQRSSLGLALRGRDAMERAVALDPGYLDARDGLMQFYAEAPWPIGSTAKARLQAAEIGRRNGARGAEAWVLLGRLWMKKGDPGAARDAFRAALALRPADRRASEGLAELESGAGAAPRTDPPAAARPKP